MLLFIHRGAKKFSFPLFSFKHQSAPIIFLTLHVGFHGSLLYLALSDWKNTQLIYEMDWAAELALCIFLCTIMVLSIFRWIGLRCVEPDHVLHGLPFHLHLLDILLLQ